MNKKNIWMRIPVFLLSGMILHVWGFFVLIFSIVQFVLILTERKTEKEFLNISSMFCSQIYCFFKYITFLSEEKPFPWGKLKKEKIK